MSRDKQIEEMAKVIARRSKDFRNPNIAFMTTAKKTAESIYNAGYRKQEWISVEERLPDPEVEVLVLTQRNGYTIITTAMHEDGSISKDDSVWIWSCDLPFIYDEENDIEYIPEGWWEYSHYNDDNECGGVSDKVTHWMPLPEAPKMKGDEGE